MRRELGASINGNASTSPSLSAAIRKITAARELRNISGSVNSGRALKSSSEYNLIQMPLETRPHRPERCFAAA